MHRFFVPVASIQGNRATVSEQQAQQIARVLRMQPGERVILLDNSGWEIEAELEAVDARQVAARVLHRRLAAGEPRTKISLYQAVPRSKKFETVLQKGTELGIVEFVPVISERCIVSDLEDVEKKRDRWQTIIQEAAEQSHRGRKPALEGALLFPRACEQARGRAGLSLILWEEEKQRTLRDVLRTPPPGRERGWPPFTVNLFVGPEGGFTADEAVLARRYGLVPITLGPRILRTETAGMAAAAAILYELGDME
ncbi:MAG: 16S rRNA (uracil(1498)-N(3))-methyltransferase [Anaerolineae bacterium]|nr:16S rRNA (uracil(1498)-N(3))-methyltransferase [Anaerolineae bacterium]